jgi:phosphoglycolate phosphatase
VAAGRAGRADLRRPARRDRARQLTAIVLFDLDGVLADSRGPISRCMNAAMRELGVRERPEEDLHPYIGPSLSLGFADLAGVTPDDPLVEALVAAYRERYAVVGPRDTRAFDGIEAALEALGDRPLGVATSKPRAYAEPLLEALRLRGYFDVVAAPELDLHVESKTETVAAALRAFGGPGRGGAMVGDRHVDMEAARVHGLRAVGVTWGIGSEEELLAAGADVLVHSPAELPGVLL